MIKHKVTFIEGRQIMDVELIASECVDTRLKGMTQASCAKL